MLPPLNNPSRLIQLIAKVTDLRPSDVQKRLIAETKKLGHTVSAEIQRRSIKPFVNSPALERFYQESDAFLFESTVWNTCKAKQNMRKFISNRLSRLDRTNQKMLCFGDGLGFDSAHFGCQGHRVRYFDPSKKCSRFAKAVFQDNQLEIKTLNSLGQIQPGSMDVIVCLDVLEHIFNPIEFVKKFSDWLKPGGLLFVNSPFWLIHSTTPTRLLANRKFSGDIKNLYRSNDFIEIDSSLFWDPILFQKRIAQPASLGPAARARVRFGQAVLYPARWFGRLHSTVARMITRPSKDFLTAIQNATFT